MLLYYINFYKYVCVFIKQLHELYDWYTNCNTYNANKDLFKEKKHHVAILFILLTLSISNIMRIHILLSFYEFFLKWSAFIYVYVDIKWNNDSNSCLYQSKSNFKLNNCKIKYIYDYYL